ncbi:MAG: hypothetical protein ABL885_06195 [Methylophilaceae bacterium]
MHGCMIGITSICRHKQSKENKFGCLMKLKIRCVIIKSFAKKIAKKSKKATNKQQWVRGLSKGQSA